MLYFMNQKIIFDITYEDGHYVAQASGKDYGIVTDGKDFEHLKKNIQEAVALYLEDENFSSKDLSSDVSLSANFKIPFPA